MRRTSTRFTVLFSVLLFALALLPVAPANASELDNRPIVTYPSSNTLTTMTSAGMSIPSGSQSYFAGGQVELVGSGVNQRGFVRINQQIDLARNDLLFTFQIRTPASVGTNLDKDFGSTFVLHNDLAYAPQSSSYGGNLGIAGVNVWDGCKRAGRGHTTRVNALDEGTRQV